MDDIEVCLCPRVVRLELPSEGKVVWICTRCNAQFVPKKAVDYKLASLQFELGRRLNEQGSGVRGEGTVS